MSTPQDKRRLKVLRAALDRVPSPRFQKLAEVLPKGWLKDRVRAKGSELGPVEPPQE